MKPHHFLGSKPKKRMRFSGDIVTIKVGQGDKLEEFKVHDTLIKAQNEFFRVALDKKWQEGQTLVLDLVDDKPEVFNAYLRWIYNETIDLSEHMETRLDQPWAFLAELYVFGEKTLDDDFCNYVVNEMIRQWGSPQTKGPRWIAVRTIYTGTSAQSPIRNLLVTMYVNKADGSWFPNHLNAEYAIDCARALVQARPTFNMPLGHRCAEWHKKKHNPAESSKGTDPNPRQGTATATNIKVDVASPAQGQKLFSKDTRPGNS